MLGRFICGITICLYGSFIHAQKGYDAKLLTGFLISHHPEMQNMEAHVWGIEVNKFHTLKHSQKPFNEMKVGVNGLYMNLGSPRINGSVLAVFYNVEANITPKAKYPIRMRFGAGLGYITKPFSFPDNISNKAIGTHFNGAMQLEYSKYFRLNESFQLATGLGLTHFSNGNFKKPNLGINMPHLNIGITYVPEAKKDEKEDFGIGSCIGPGHNLAIVLGYAKREISIDDPQSIHIFMVGAEYKIPRKLGHSYRLGTDFFFDPSYPYQKFSGTTSGNKLGEILEHGIRAGYEWYVNRMSLTADFGVYTYRPKKIKRRHYFVLGLDYDINRSMSAFVKLKTHLSVADYFQWGLTLSPWKF